MLYSIFQSSQTTGSSQAFSTIMLVSIAPALILSLVVFWNRWRVTEAFSSRFCSGSAMLSVFYVPIIALIYANYRGIKKFWGK
jgi:uncharacterized membrane protein